MITKSELENESLKWTEHYNLLEMKIDEQAWQIHTLRKEVTELEDYHEYYLRRFVRVDKEIYNLNKDIQKDLAILIREQVDFDRRLRALESEEVGDGNKDS